MDFNLPYLLREQPDIENIISLIEKAWEEGIPMEVEDHILTQNEYKLEDKTTVKKETLYAEIRWWLKMGVHYKEYEQKWEKRRIGTTHYYDFDGDKYYMDNGMIYFRFLVYIIEKYQDIYVLSQDMALIYNFHLFIKSLPKNLRLLFSIEIIRITPIDVIKKLSNNERLAIDIFELILSTADNKKEFLLENYKSTDMFSEEDCEVIASKWDEYKVLGDTSLFYDWLDEKFGSQIDEYIEQEFHGSIRLYNDYSMKQLIESGLDIDRFIPPLEPIDFERLEIFCYLFGEGYEKWKIKFRENNCLPPMPKTEDSALDYSKDIYYYLLYDLFEKNFECFFRMMNSEKITENDCLYVYSRLKERKLSYYIQQRYDEYRKNTGKGRELQFYKRPDVEEAHKALMKYYNKLEDDRVNIGFERYLPIIIDEVVPNLKDGVSVNAFVRILWRDNFHFSKDRKKSEDPYNYPAFRKDIVDIFHLNHIPAITSYTANKENVVSRSKDLWNTYEVFQLMIDKKQL